MSPAPDAYTFIPTLDKDTAFVQSHPLNAGVNAKVFANFSVSYFNVKPWIFTDLAKVGATPYFQIPSPSMLGTNIVLSPSDPMYYYTKRIASIGSGNYKTAILSALRTDSTYSTPAVPVLKTVIAFLRKEGDYKLIVLLCDDLLKPSSEYFHELYPNTPDVVIGVNAKIDTPCVVANGSYFFCDIAADGSKERLASIVIDSAMVSGNVTVTNVSYTNPLLTLTSAQKDAQYYADQAFLLNEAQTATANDPTVSSTSVTMPSGGRWDSTYPCYVGECGQGTLYARSYLYKYPAEIAFTSSGGLRGPGWLPGPIKLSDVWAAAPYSNNYCTGRLLGLRVWQLFDLSMRKARFNLSFTDTGDRMLQASGVKVEVNPGLGDESHRLISIKVYSNITNTYEPLQRLQYYSFTSDNYLCESMADLSTIFQTTLYTGEYFQVFTDSVVQEGVADYLKSHNPYDNIYSNWFSKVTSTAAMVWSAAQVDCGTKAYWSSGLSSCVSCPTGQESAGTSCVPEKTSQDLSIIYKIAVPVGVVLLGSVILFAVWMECRRRGDVRNVANAPRGGDVAIVFTDIQSSTKLWGTVPASMASALDTHHAVIRAALAKHNGYEVKTVGDSFMMALHTPEDAVRLCVTIQKDLHSAAWPAGIDEMYEAPNEEALGEIDDDPTRMAEVSDGPWNGLRVRCGINFGPTEAVFDEVAKGYDYYGPTVNVAARVESAAFGGQVLISRSVDQALGSRLPT